MDPVLNSTKSHFLELAPQRSTTIGLEKVVSIKEGKVKSIMASVLFYRHNGRSFMNGCLAALKGAGNARIGTGLLP